MTRHEFQRFAARKIIRLDGATGTELAKLGMPPGVSPEYWCLENPDAITKVQQSYREAGSEIIYAPTFGGNPVKLAEFGLEEKTAEINTALAKLSRKACPGTLIFGDIAPTGMLVEPFGPLPFEEAVALYRRQITALAEGGVDGFAIETMMCLQEARAALIAAREAAPDLPVIVTMTFEAGGRTLTGDDPVAALLTLQSLGADAFGCNCSTGPVEMAGIIRKLKPFAKIPLIAKPNAGMPRLVDNQTVFDMDAGSFAAAASQLAEAGAGIIGGCCGTTPAHIAALNRALGETPPPVIKPALTGAVCSNSRYRRLAPEEPFTLIGERINPTGKKALQAELRAGSLAMVKNFAVEQEEAGAHILDVNFGLGGIDEAAVMRRAIGEIVLSSSLPLCIDTVDAGAAEAALRLYPGRALFNSISAEKNRLEKLLPIMAKYGAMPVLLPLSDEGIPDGAGERMDILRLLLKHIAAYGYTPDECATDLLVMTVSADQEAPKKALKFLKLCRKEINCNTVCGLSNVSFGLPNRPAVNAAFLGIAAGCGLNMAIANPSAPGIAEFIPASNALLGKDPELAGYLAYAAAKAPSAQSPAAAPAADGNRELPPTEALRHAVINGRREDTENLIDQLIAANEDPSQLVNGILIPAITEVGNRFERKEFYLPQLMQSADAMSKAMAKLEPLLLKNSGGEQQGPLFIIATVEGDIHDIGKNILALLLKNHNFRVMDLGRNVNAAEILKAVREHQPEFLGLSALMTTTMPRMKEVIDLLRSEGIQTPVFVGGAAVDEVYAAGIGAYYGADAMASVRVALDLLAKKEKC